MANIQTVPSINPSIRYSVANTGRVPNNLANKRATVATYMDRDGVPQLSAPGQVRVDWGPDGQCLGILSEGAVQNIALQSDNHSASPWTVSGVTLDTQIPQGAMKFTPVMETTANVRHGITQKVVGSEDAGTIQFFVRYRNRIDIAYRPIVTMRVGSGDAAFVCHVNLLTGEIRTGVTGGYQSGRAAWSVDKYTSGIIRVHMAFNNTTGPDELSVFSSNAATLDAATHLPAAFVGDVTKGFFLGGVNWMPGTFAAGKFAWIPTTTSPVTKAADYIYAPVPITIGPRSLFTITYKPARIIQGFIMMFTGTSAVVASLRPVGASGANDGLRIIGSPQVFSLTHGSSSMNAHVPTPTMQYEYRSAFTITDSQFNLASGGTVATPLTNTWFVPGKMNLTIGAADIENAGGTFCGHISDLMIYDDLVVSSVLQNITTPKDPT